MVGGAAIEGLQHNYDESILEESVHAPPHEHGQQRGAIVRVGCLSVPSYSASTSMPAAAPDLTQPPAAHAKNAAASDAVGPTVYGLHHTHNSIQHAFSGHAPAVVAACSASAASPSSAGAAAVPPPGKLGSLKQLSAPAFVDPLCPESAAAGGTDKVGSGGGGSSTGAGDAAKAKPWRNSKRRLTEEISECLQIFRQRDGVAGGMTPVLASARSASVLGGRLLGEGAGTPKASRLLKSPVKMFTYQASD